MEKLWTKEGLLQDLFLDTGFKLATITLWSWEKKGLYTPYAYFMDGKQKRPIYDIKNYNILKELAIEAIKTNSSRLKIKSL